MQGKLIFITGGVRSGKSSYAEDVTSSLGSDITYIATAQAFDDEMRHRIYLHRERRPDSWKTVEEPLDVTGAIRKCGNQTEVIMLDCLTMLVSNLMFQSPEAEAGLSVEDQKKIIDEIRSVAEAAKEAAAHVVIVSNEVGLTLVSDNKLGRVYQEIVGSANQVVAALADEAYLVVSGLPVTLKKGRS